MSKCEHDIKIDTLNCYQELKTNKCVICDETIAVFIDGIKFINAKMLLEKLDADVE